MKKYLFLQLILCCAKLVFAQQATPLSSTLTLRSGDLIQISPAPPTRPAARPERDTVMLDRIVRTGAAISLPVNLRIEHCGLVLSLLQNTQITAAEALAYSADASVKVSFRKRQDPARLDTLRLRLHIDNTLTPGAKPQSKDAFVIPDVIWADILVDSFACTGLSSPEAAENANLFFLKSEISGAQYEIARPAEMPLGTRAGIADNGGYITIGWNAMSWAESYDLEWTFVDQYGPAPVSGMLPYTFRNNATRVNISQTSYEIPLIFERGLLVFRIRGNGRRADGSLVAGQWSKNESGTLSAVGTGALISGVVRIPRNMVHEQDRKNWQYMASFAENGLRRDVVSYMDGTLRNRQSITRLNTNGQYLIIGETFYDHQGRAAILSLPTPFKPNPGSERIGPEISGPTGFSPPTPGTVFTPKKSGKKFEASDLSGKNKKKKNDPFANLSLTDLVGLGTASPISWTLNTPAIQGAAGGFSVLPGIELPGSTTPILPPGLWTEIYNYESTSPAVRYQPRFNVNSSGRPYSRSDFDTLATPNRCAPNPPAQAFGTTSGAGYYYSPANRTAQLHRDLIPDAEGFPFVHTEYTPDETGRLQKQGAPGRTHQIGRGHDQQMYYATPTQMELDRIFGNDAGASHLYKKTVARDPNGQISIAYQNSQGQTIATGLAGNTPDNLLPIARNTMPQRTDIVAENTRWEAEGAVKVSSRPVIIVQDNTDLSLSYSLDPQQFSTATCDGAVLCDNCVYELHIRLTDPCGKELWHESRRIGTLDDLQNCTASSTATATQSLRLNAGTYNVEKYLRINTENRERFVGRYIEQIRPCVQSAIEPGIEAVPCASNVCKPCDLRFNTFEGVQAWTRLANNDPGCERFCNGAGMPSHFAYEALLRDMRPGGQYGEIFSTTPEGVRTAMLTTFPLSVFNTTNQLSTLNTLPGLPGLRRRDYRNPLFPYRNADGTLAEIDVSDMPEAYYDRSGLVLRAGRKYVSPKDLLDPVSLNDRWQDAWSESLVPFHPEYPYLMWDLANQNAIAHDSLMMRTASWAAALEQNLIQTNGAITAEFLRRDPFFSSADRVEQMRTALNNFEIAGSRLNINQLIRLNIRCNSPYYSDATRSAALTACYGTGNLTDLAPEEQQLAWEMFRSIYLSKKSLVMDRVRAEELRGAGIMENNCIETTTFSCPTCSDSRLNGLLGRKSRRFQRMACFSGGTDELPLRRIDRDGDGSYSDTPGGFRPGAGSLSPACGVEQVAQQWLYFLTALQLESQLIAANFTIPARPPMVLTPDMIAEFPNRSTVNYRWSGTLSGSALNIRITDPGALEQARMQLRIETVGVNWQDIAAFTCIQCSGGNEYFLTAYTKNEYREVRIRMVSENGFNLRNTCLQGGAPSGEKDQFAPVGAYQCCVPVFPPRQPAPPCNVAAELIERANENRAVAERLAFLADSIRGAYTRRCMAAVEHLGLSWDEPVYHFTLFYYDQAGNLIKSVPPKGVGVMNDPAQLEQVRRHRANPLPANPPAYPEHNDADGNPDAFATLYQYNSFNQRISRTTPDGGTTRWRYDQVGRTILAQDAVQAERGVYNFMEYDAQGRIIETGIVPAHADFNERITGTGMLPYSRFRNRLARSAKSEVYRTRYDEALLADVQAKFKNGAQERLRNRVAATAFYADGTGEADYITHFSYDIAGNVVEFLQDYRALSREMEGPEVAAHCQKLIRYQYDLITGNVKEIAYQPGAADQFYQWFLYDADNRIIAVQSGQSQYECSDARDKDVRYQYYLHGPLARAAFAQANVQGLDFAYTILGKLKNINSVSPNNDPGADGFANLFATDATALSLGYFNNDYKPIGRSAASPANAALNEAAPGLYNGNIRYSISRNNGLDAQPVLASAYRYDQMHRLRSATILLPGASGPASASTGDAYFDPAAEMSWTASDNWRMRLEYDPNGNITRLNRRNATGAALDDLTYNYAANSNRLTHIRDTDGQIAATGTVVDLPTQNPNNYQYDSKGRLLLDRSEGNAELSWSANDKLLHYRRDGQDTRFAYDAFGRRALKKSDNQNGILSVRDPVGNILSNYQIRDGHVFWQDVPLYATARIGAWQPGDSLVMSVPALRHGVQHFRFQSGEKAFELTNHTGDVLALVSDRKLPVNTGGTTTWAPDYLQAQDYYAFGMPMPGRVKESTHSYAFGFQGMERDNDLKGNGNSYNTEFRQYDPRVGRWLSLDPKADKYPAISPFAAFLNDPIALTDPRGDDPPAELLNTFNQGIRDYASRARAGIEWQDVPNGEDFLEEVIPGAGLIHQVGDALILLSERGRPQLTGTDVAVGISTTAWNIAEVIIENGVSVEDADEQLAYVLDLVRASGIDIPAHTLTELGEGLVDAEGMAVSSFTMMLDGLGAVLNNVSELHEYTGKIEGFEYQIALVAARLRSLEEGASVATLFDEGDSRLTDSRAGILFNGISSNGLEANYAQGTADARRYIKEFEQREGGREALIFMLEHYRRSAGSGFENAGSIQEQIDRRTGVGRTRTTVDSEFRAHSH